MTKVPVILSVTDHTHTPLPTPNFFLSITIVLPFNKKRSIDRRMNIRKLKDATCDTCYLKKKARNLRERSYFDNFHEMAMIVFFQTRRFFLP